jgi:hypothetical protein
LQNLYKENFLNFLKEMKETNKQKDLLRDRKRKMFFEDDLTDPVMLIPEETDRPGKKNYRGQKFTSGKKWKFNI